MAHPNTELLDALSEEIATSEVLRIKIIVISFASMFVLSLGFYLVAAERYNELFRGRVNVALLPAFFGGVTVFYALAFAVISRLARKKKTLPLPGRLFNAAMEGTVPSFALWLFAPQGDLAAGLAMPPLFAYAFFVILSVLRLNPWICLTTGLSAAITYIAFVYHIMGTNQPPYPSLLFTMPNHFVKAFFILGGAAIAGFVASQLRQRVLHVIESQRKKQEIEALFGEHVSQEVVQKLLTSRDTNLAEIRHITALFLDIRSFTTFSESRSAHEVYTELNKLLEFMIDIVHAHSGIINKFLGDGFLAVFGAPLDDNSHAINAVKTALVISDELKKRTEAGTVAALGIGIGIHSGEALTGNVGSDKRKEYTVIGDVINVASRIEQLNKQFASEILVSEEVRVAAGESFQFVEKGEVPVKGREKPVRVFSPKA